MKPILGPLGSLRQSSFVEAKLQVGEGEGELAPSTLACFSPPDLHHGQRLQIESDLVKLCQAAALYVVVSKCSWRSKILLLATIIVLATIGCVVIVLTRLAAGGWCLAGFNKFCNLKEEDQDEDICIVNEILRL